MKTTNLKTAFQKFGADEMVIIKDFSTQKSLPSRTVKHYLVSWTEKTLTTVRVYKVTAETDQKGIYCPCIWVSGADLASNLAVPTAKKAEPKPAPKPTTKKAQRPSAKKTTKKSPKTSAKPSPKPASKPVTKKTTKLSELSSILGDRVVESIDIVDGKLVITL